MNKSRRLAGDSVSAEPLLFFWQPSASLSIFFLFIAVLSLLLSVKSSLASLFLLTVFMEDGEIYASMHTLPQAGPTSPVLLLKLTWPSLLLSFHLFRFTSRFAKLALQLCKHSCYSGENQCGGWQKCAVHR